MIDPYPKLPDEIILDWYAGAYAERNHPNPEPDGKWDWEPGDACLGFTDIGLSDSQTGPKPHAQIVLTILGHDGRVRAISLEIDHNDALYLARALNSWIESTRE